MPTSERSEEVLERLLSRRLNEWMVKPDYECYGLSNLVSSILWCFDVPGLGYRRVPDDGLEGVLEGAEHLILLLVDGLPYAKMAERRPGRIIPLTSTFPSTTTTALTTLNTGLTPQEHAIIGFTMYLKEIGIVLSLTNLAPSAAPYTDALLKAGLEPSSILGTETIHTRLRRRGVNSIVATRRIYRESPLTSMLGAGTEIETYVSPSDLFVKTRRIIEEAKTPTFLFLYWDGLDIVEHIYGPEGEEAEAELKSLLHSLKEHLLARARGDVAKKTAFLLVSDHGHIAIQREEVLICNEHPHLLEALHIPPTGDSRAACLYPKPDMRDKIVEYVYSRLSDRFEIYDVRDLIKEGLFGYGKVNQKLLDRTGEFMLLPKKGAAVSYNYKPDEKGFQLKGGHGGLDQKEVLVPLLYRRLVE